MHAKIPEQSPMVTPVSWDVAMQLVPQLPHDERAAREVLACMAFLLDLKYQRRAGLRVVD